MDQEKIGKFIKDLRKSNNLTQQEFADTLGVTFQAVSKWENGKNIPDVSVMKIISEKYNVNVDEILDGKKGKKSHFNKMILGLIILCLVVVGIIIVVSKKPKDNDYMFKDVVSTCEEFKISGVAAFDSTKSSFYISNVEYCGSEENDTVYDTITCTLYEMFMQDKQEISKCEVYENTTLDNFLKNVSIKVENYSSVCKEFNKARLLLEISATSKNNEDYRHEIPLKITTCN